MILIGLRNADKKYDKTRHNAGAILLTHMVESAGQSFENDKYSDSQTAEIAEGKIYLPNTFMNLSGEVVKKILKKEAIDFSSGKDLSKDIFVYFDDVTQSVGKWKNSVGEGASSHNGIKSIVENLGGNNTFTRVRIGVGKVLPDGKLYEPGPDKLSDFVLGNLNNLEIVQIKGLSFHLK